jgi:hypothetical protein
MTAKPKKIETTEDFQEMINLLAVFTAATNQLNDLQSEANEDMLEWLDTAKGEYASLQETLTKAEAALEIIARRHPEWFQTKKSIKTPYGVVKLTSSTSLEIPNEEATLVRMELKKERSQILAEAARAEGKEFPVFDPEAFIRTTRELDREALEKLSDLELAELGITRVVEENFSVKPATLDLGKAVKEAVATESTNTGAEQEAA